MIRWGLVVVHRDNYDYVKNPVDALPRKGLKHMITAVSDIKASLKIEEVAKKYDVDISKVTTSYKELAERDDVEVVYCHANIFQTYDIIKYCLEKDKHVMVTPPLTMNLKLAQSLISLARTKEVLLIERHFGRFSPAYDSLRQQIESGRLGEVLHIETSWGFKPGSRDIASGNCLILYAGVGLLDIVQFIFHDEPQNVKVTAIGKAVKGCDNVAITVIMKYPGGRSAVLHMHDRYNLSQETTIYGTKSYVTLNLPGYVPTKLITNDADNNECEKSFPLPPGGKTDLIYAIKEVGRCIVNEIYESPLMTYKEMENRAQLIDEMRRQLGIKFDVDDD